MPPLDNDPDKTGKPSDHNIVLMRPISNAMNIPARHKKTVTFRPLPQSGIHLMGQWITSHDFTEVYDAITAHEKAEIIQQLLITQLNNFLPEKTVKITSDDQPWINHEIKQLDRQRKREYWKNKKSEKWKKMNDKFKQKCNEAKSNYTNSMVNDLKSSNPKQWYLSLIHI